MFPRKAGNLVAARRTGRGEEQSKALRRPEERGCKILTGRRSAVSGHELLQLIEGDSEVAAAGADQVATIGKGALGCGDVDTQALFVDAGGASGDCDKLVHCGAALLCEISTVPT